MIPICNRSAVRNTVIRMQRRFQTQMTQAKAPGQRSNPASIIPNKPDDEPQRVKQTNSIQEKLDELMYDSSSVVFSSADDRGEKRESPSRHIAPISYLKIPKEELDRIDLEQRIGYIRGFRAQIHGQYAKSKGTGTVIMGAGACSDQHQRTKLGRFHHKGHLECVYGKRGKVGMKMNMDFDIAKIVDTAYIHYKEEDKIQTSRRKNPRRYPIRHAVGSPAAQFWKKSTPFSERQ